MKRNLEALPPVNEEGFYFFKRSEFDCSHTGKNEFSDDFIHRLDHLRYMCGFPLKVTSGYRHHTHPVEAVKKSPGEHNRGAADFYVANGYEKRKLVECALVLGFGGIGVADNFVHVDDRAIETMWTY